MAKNIVIFSDGTGQAGGLIPDEQRTNVYKLFRAARCGPESSIDPKDQIAFYDPGLGSRADGDHIKIGLWRKIYNFFSQTTGLGITRNIIDCYSFILRVWEPGDRIFLFGFSRGAYTVRSVGGVLALCGVPTVEDGVPVRRDPKTAKRLAREAVINIYKHGAGLKWRKDEFAAQRKELAQVFRATYGSNNDDGEANAVPYLIGVWDTVAALGMRWGALLLIALTALIAIYSLISLNHIIFNSNGNDAYNFGLFAAQSLGLLFCGLLLYLYSRLKYATNISWPWWKTLHFTAFKMKFHNNILSDRVRYAVQALSIDENRKDFAPVIWDESHIKDEWKRDESFQQTWFAGVHSDVGGSYPENESRLSDIALAWMADAACSLPEPLHLDRRFLNLFPDAGGMQHDQRKSAIFSWPEGLRDVAPKAPLHNSVVERRDLPQVLHYDEMKPYRPEALRDHILFKDFI